MFNIVVIGTGGTGSCFLQKLARYCSVSAEKINVFVVDGDIVEEKNLVRQQFCECNVGQSKAAALVELAADNYGLEWTAVSEYLLHAEQLDDIFVNDVGNVKILVGCVDNHAARRIMEEWFSHQRNAIYIDSANDEFDGEVVVSVRADGLEISPMRSFFFSDVLTDDAPSVVELSCEQRNISSPQHQATNEMAGNIIFMIICEIIKRQIPTGMVVFNAENFSMRRLPFTKGKLVV